MRKPIIIVIARTFVQAKYHMNRLGLAQSEWHYADRPQRLMGLERAVIIRCGQPPDSADGIRADLEADRMKALGRATIIHLPD